MDSLTSLARNMRKGFNGRKFFDGVYKLLETHLANFNEDVLD